MALADWLGGGIGCCSVSAGALPHCDSATVARADWDGDAAGRCSVCAAWLRRRDPAWVASHGLSGPIGSVAVLNAVRCVGAIRRGWHRAGLGGLLAQYAVGVAGFLAGPGVAVARKWIDW